MRSSHIFYIDGFAGPGEYEGGEPGSPIIALQAALEQASHIAAMTFLFVEAREDRIEHLKGQIKKVDLPAQFRVEYQRGEFKDVVTSVLDRVDARGSRSSPTFAFVDPFGIKGMPMALLHRILSYPKAEVFASFMIDPANRWIDHPEEVIRDQVRELLGKDELDDEERGFAALRRVYQSQLEQEANYVRSFQMLNENSQPIYDLFFGSNHPKGHEKMKEAMWKVDPSGDFRFSDATNPDQLVLFTQEPGKKLLEQIMERYAGQPRVQVNVIRAWVVADTPFLETHMKGDGGALTLGEERGLYMVRPTKSDGSKRRSGSFSDEVVIDFSRRPPRQTSLFGG
jgi:three-Cys-motif partner protein